VREHLATIVPAGDNPFAALNTAFFADGALVRVREGVTLDQPIQLVYLSTGSEQVTSTKPRNLIVAEKNARVTLVESYLSLGAAPHFTNAVTEVSAAREAVVEILKLQDENLASIHMATIGGVFGRDSRVWLHSFSLGARLARNNIRTRLSGPGLECVLNGLYLTRGEQLADHHMIVEHAEPHCASHEYFNGILDDRSRGVFHGRILVQPPAQKTDAKQTNKNILLSDDAVANAKPQLEIYADDVKCTHGATVGQLDEDAVFYLRARGIGRDTARRMLIHAFAGEIIERIQHEPIRDELDELVWDRLEQNPHLNNAA
jgi:Fe-S cluster assembly protein SufD